MSPIILKIEGNESFLPFANLNQEELSKTWRVCSKVKDSLENGSRFENLSWRLWFIQNVSICNDTKRKTKPQNNSTLATQKAEAETELTRQQQPLDNSDDKDFITNDSNQQLFLQQTIDYNANEIKPVGTENFILNRFTSDQEIDQMIELKNIFEPFEMPEFMYTFPEEDSMAGKQLCQSNNWNNTNSNNNENSDMTDSNTVPNTNVNLDDSYNPSPQNQNQQLFYNNSDVMVDPISGIQSLFSEEFMQVPSMAIPSDPNQQYFFGNNLINNQEIVVDSNNAAYVAAAAATSAVALNTIPNATLHNKLLATLPRQTLASAEKLLSPTNTVVRRNPLKCPLPTEPQTTLKKTKMQRTVPPTIMQQHYFSTFQLDTTPNNAASSFSHSSVSSAKNNSTDKNNNITNLIPMEEETPNVCSNCEITTTPLWRRSIDDKMLCNACGLYVRLRNVPRPKQLNFSLENRNRNEVSPMPEEESSNDINDSKIGDTKQAPPQQVVCSNCSTVKTPLWRRDTNGTPLCNACGLYLKLHNEKRPLSMKTDVIKKRQRVETFIPNVDRKLNDLVTKKPRHYEQQAFYSSAGGESEGISLVYGDSPSLLPGAGILMMNTLNKNYNRKSN